MDITSVFEHYTADENGCWNWTLGKSKGYGAINYMGRVWLAHRVAYEMTKGRIPDGMSVCHSCDNPGCINPDHLFAGTHRDNMIDKETKGRANHVGMSGTKNHNARLTEAKVISLLRDYVAGIPRRELCNRFGLQESSLSSYTDGKAWTHLHCKHGCPTFEELQRAKRRTPAPKIDLNIAREMKRRLAAGELGKDLAIAYGVHKATISDIRQGKIWRDA